MRRRNLSVLAFCVLLGCARPAVTLDRVQGVYTTHFDGIPDESRVCAVLTNRGDVPVSWVRMRLLSFAEPERRSRFVSHWVLRESLAPGESAAIELENPPVVQEVELSVQRAGTSQAPVGRPVHRSEICSQAALVAEAEAARTHRTAEGIEIRALAWRGARDRDALVASD